MCAKYKDMLVTKRSVHLRADNILQASNDSSVDKSVWFRLKDSSTSGILTSMQVRLFHFCLITF
jgi:hypothetical protein